MRSVMETNGACFESGEMPRVMDLPSLIRLLTREGAKHHSLYHYTRWDAFAKMMQPVAQGVCKGHRKERWGASVNARWRRLEGRSEGEKEGMRLLYE